MSDKNECLSCDCWDSDLEGCTMPDTSKPFACSLESDFLHDPCINYEPESENVVFADCETCKHFLGVHYATESEPAVGLCDLSPKK